MKLSFLLAQFPGMPELPTDSIPDPKQELASLKSLSFDELINRLVSDVVEFAVHLAIAILVFYVGRFIINKLYSFVSAVLSRREVEESLSSFILSLVRIVLYFILIVTVIGILGINTSSFLAIFASVGVAIGMALSGTLQNFAGGVLILLLKPYRIGDFIEAQGFTGTVTDIQIFSTWICTSDNKTIIIPNGGLSTGTITNWSKQNYRRIQWDVGISYGDDFRSAARAIHRIMASVKEIVFLDAEGNIIADRPDTVSAVEIEKEANNGTVLDEQRDVDSSQPRQAPSAPSAAQPASEPEAKPKKKTMFSRMGRWFAARKARVAERHRAQAATISAVRQRPPQSPSVNISGLADSSVNLVVRAWVASSAYWPVYYYVLQQIYALQPKEDYNFPFPQMDVHIVPQTPPADAPSKA